MSTLVEKVTRLRNMLHRRMQTGGYINSYRVMTMLDDIVKHGEIGNPHPVAIKFPPHKASLTLTHNQCHDYYQTVAEMIEEEEARGNAHGWVTEEEKQKAIEANDYWAIQVYPHTPVGFYLYYAHSLDVLMAFVNRTE